MISYALLHQAFVVEAAGIAALSLAVSSLPLLVAAVGGTAAGVSLLELTCDAFARLRKQMPDARMLLVTGPRIDPRLLPDIEGMDKQPHPV